MGRKGKLSHALCRERVCIACFGYANKVLKPYMIEHLRNFFPVNFDFNATTCPAGICNSCLFKLRGKREKPLEVLHTSFDFIILASNADGSCDCQICNVARATKFPTKAKKVNVGRPKENKIDLFELTCKICKTRFEDADKFGRHKCGRKTYKRKLYEEVKDMKDVAEKVTSTTLRRSKRSPKGTIRLDQPQGGSKLPVTIGSAKVPKPKPQVSHREIMDIAKRLGEKEAKKMASFINKKFGKGSVQPFYQKELHDQTRIFETDMCVSQLSFEKGKVSVDRYLVHVKDLSDFVLKVYSIRKLDFGSTKVKLGIDKGGGLLKVSISIIDDLEDPKEVLHKCTGVNKIFVVACVAEVEESHHNFKVILDAIGAYNVDFFFSCDLKAGNMLTGVGSNSSKYPCLSCEVVKDELATTKGVTRTIGLLNERHRALLETKQRPKDKQACKSVVNFQILTSDTNDPQVLSRPSYSFIAPFTLHLKTGIFKHLFSWLRATLPELADLWTQHVFAHERKYHGGEFVGNDVDQLLSTVDFLESEAYKLNEGIVALPYVQAFRDFAKAKKACFGRDLDPNYPAIIEKFRVSAEALEVKHMSTKFHYFYFHLADWIKDYGQGKGLSDVSEETPESLHAAFNKQLKRFKVFLGITIWNANDLLRATVAFNSNNI